MIDPDPTITNSAPRSRRPDAPRAGVTLLELLAAIAIVSGSIVAGLSLFGAKAQASGSVVLEIEGLRYLTREIERVHARSYDFLDSVAQEPIDEDSRFERRWVVTRGTDEVQVLVEVYFTSAAGTARTLSATVVRGS